MQKHFGVVIGIAMLAIAVVIVVQTVDFRSVGLQGSVVDTSTDTSAGDTGGDQPDSSDGCQMDIVDGIIKQCCKIRYSAFFTCQYYADMFDTLCEKEGVECSVVEISCTTGVGHAINEARIDGKLCLIDSEKRRFWCDIGDKEKYNAALCDIMGIKKEECSCKSVKTPSRPPSDFSICALHYAKEDLKNQDVYDKCTSCCTTQVQYEMDRKDPTATPWFEECKNACNQMKDTSVCGRRTICTKKYLGSCDPVSCTQLYNSGLCITGKNECMAISRTCQNSGITCKNPSRISSSAGSSVE